MSNLLPEQYRKTLVREYKLRRLIVVTWFVFILSLISLAFFVPAFVFIKIDESLVGLQDNKSASAPTDAVGNETKNVSKTLAELDRASKIARELGSNPVAFSVYEVMRVLQFKPPSIRINEVAYVNKQTVAVDDGGSAGSKIVVTMKGVADTRESLTVFGKFLAARPEFENVDVPISSFTKTTDIDFSLTAEVRNQHEIK